MEFVQQRSKLDCGVACMAMLLHCSYDEVTKYFTNIDFNSQEMDDDMLKNAIQQYGKETKFSDDINLTEESIIILPSLNNVNSQHSVCWTGSEVFDPNRGNKNKKYYTTEQFMESQKDYQITLK